MAPKTAKKLIKDALANLKQGDLEHFSNELLDRREEPRVKRNQVEGKSYLDIADVLISTFTEDGAPAVVVELLKGIGCNDPAKELEKEIQSSNPGSSDTVRPSAGAVPGCTGADFVDKHRVELIDRVSNVKPILDELLEKEVITHGPYKKFLAMSDSSDCMRELLSGPLRSAGPEGKEVFFKILEKTEKFLVADLKKKK